MADFEVRLLSSLAKVFPRNAPFSRHEEIWLSALGGETISFQVAYKQNEDIFRSWITLKVETANDEVVVNTRRVRYMPGYMPGFYKTDDGYLNSEDGLFPDLLESFDRLPSVTGVWQCIWVDIVVPPEAKSGRYPIKANLISADGEDLCSVETSFEIIAVDILPLDIPRTHWFHTDCLAEYYGVEVFSEKYWEIVENFASYAVKHGINTLLTPIHTPPLDTEVGGERLTVQLIDVTVTEGSDGDVYTFDFGKMERWVYMCRRVGVEYYEIAHLFTQWGAYHAPKIMGKKNGEYRRLFGWETDAAGAEYAGYLRQMLPALTAKLVEWGISDNVFFHISDEPNMDTYESYSSAWKIVGPLLNGYKIVDALTNYEFYKQGMVSVPVPAVDHIEPFLDGNVDELWCYYCCVQSYKVPNAFFMLPSYRSRILGVLMYKYNIAGFLQWGYNFYSCMHSIYPVNPFCVTDADGTFPSGDAFLVYPGKDGKPLASLRLLVVQEAFKDFMALKMLDKSIGRDEVVKLIDKGLAEPITFSSYPQNEEYILNLRQLVNRKIAEN